MGTKMAVSFANIFTALIETKLIQQSETKHRGSGRTGGGKRELYEGGKREKK